MAASTSRRPSPGSPPARHAWSARRRSGGRPRGPSGERPSSPPRGPSGGPPRSPECRCRRRSGGSRSGTPAAWVPQWEHHSARRRTRPRRDSPRGAPAPRTSPAPGRVPSATPRRPLGGRGSSRLTARCRPRPRRRAPRGPSVPPPPPAPRRASQADPPVTPAHPRCAGLSARCRPVQPRPPGGQPRARAGVPRARHGPRSASRPGQADWLGRQCCRKGLMHRPPCLRSTALARSLPTRAE
mmetsp:Transcript_66016/g.204325  ORF Transcript_66016/g.204325 Transcript_66016/m.204325 type:complete len:241 (+) Transcript_66016:398-1120(+)